MTTRRKRYMLLHFQPTRSFSTAYLILKTRCLQLRTGLLTLLGVVLKTPDPFIIPAEMQDLDDDGSKELIFGISSGFSIYPRNVYGYYVSKYSLVISPESSFFIFNILQADITW